MNNLDAQFRSGEREGFYEPAKHKRSLRKALSRERDMEAILHTRLAHSLADLPPEIFHKKSIKVKVAGTDDSYTCTLEKETDVFNQDQLIIGYGDYNVFHELMQEPGTTRSQAMWQVLYGRLGMRMPTDIVLECSRSQGISVDSVEAIVKRTSDEWLAKIENHLVSYSREIAQLAESSEDMDNKTKMEVVNRTVKIIGNIRSVYREHFVRQLYGKADLEVTKRAALILSADFQETSKLVTVDEQELFKGKIKKLIHIVTTDEVCCRSFYADEFYSATAEGKMPRNQWELVNHFVCKFLDTGSKETYPFLLVPSRKEAAYHKKMLSKKGYNNTRLKRISRKPLVDKDLLHPKNRR